MLPKKSLLKMPILRNFKKSMKNWKFKLKIIRKGSMMRWKGMASWAVSRKKSLRVIVGIRRKKIRWKTSTSISKNQITWDWKPMKKGFGFQNLLRKVNQNLKISQRSPKCFWKIGQIKSSCLQSRSSRLKLAIFLHLKGNTGEMIRINQAS